MMVLITLKLKWRVDPELASLVYGQRQASDTRQDIVFRLAHVDRRGVTIIESSQADED